MTQALAPEPTLEMPADRLADLDAVLNERLADLPPEDITPESEAAPRAAAALDEAAPEVQQPKAQTEQIEPKTGTPEAGKPTAEDAPKPTGDQPKAEGEQQQQEQPKAQSKFAKEQERREKSWKQLNEEKEALAKEREQRERDYQERVKAQEARERQWQEEHPEYTPEQYETAAKAFEARGQLDMADAMRAQAKAAQARGVKPQGLVLTDGIKASFAQVAKEFPEFRDTQNPLHGSLLKLVMEERPDLLRIPDGPYLAAQHLRLAAAHEAATKTASEVPALRDENAKLKAKVEELTKLTSIHGNGGPARLPDGSRNGNLSIEEEGAALRRDLAGR